MSKASSYPYEDGFFLDEKNKEVYHINLSEDGDKFFDLSFFGGSCRRNGLDKKESIEFITEIKRIHNFFKSDKLLVGGL